MHDLEISWPEGTARFSPDDSPVEVGRSPDAAVILTEPSVSRRHIEFVWNGSAWTAADSSTHGSFDPIGVRLAPNWTVGTDTTIRLGGVEGVEVRIELVTTGAGSHDRSRQVADAAPPAGFAEEPAFDPPPAPAVSGAAMAPGDYPPPSSPQSDTGAPPAPSSPSVFDQPAGAALPPPAAFDDAPPPPDRDRGGPSAFDQPPPSGYDQGYDQAPPPPGHGPSEYDDAEYDDAPAGHDHPPAPPGYDQGYDEPPAPPGYEQAADGDRYDPPGHSSPHGAPGDLPLTETGAIPNLGSTTSVSDATLQLSIDGQDYTFLPGTEVTLGREPSCLVHVDERHSLVSRRHLKIMYRDDAWWIEDFSSKGTFVDGKRLSAPYKAEGAFLVQLGDDDAGTALRVITAGEHKAPRRQSLGLLIAIGVLALIAIAALVLALRGGDDEGSQTLAVPAAATDSGESAAASAGTTAAATLATAKQATVLLIADEGTGGLGFGSGFFVTDELIVTNQHVADLDETLLVAVSRVPDDPAVVEFSSVPVARHPFLDIAVLRLTEPDGAEARSGLQPVTLGETASLTLGDDVFNTGFPATLSLISRNDMENLQLPPVGTTRGDAASFSIWPGCSNPDFEAFIPIGSPESVTCSPDGDISRGIVLTTFSSGEGASGSPVFHGDEVIAVVFAGPLDEANAGRAISTDAFRPWLDEIIAANS